MTEQFNCPNCGARVEYTGDQATMNCPFCNSIIKVPQEYVQAAQQHTEEAAEAQVASKWTKWIIIGTILLFVVPTCLGFGGTIFGIVASILASLIGVIASLTGAFTGR
jgi:hypothetical protein